MIQVYKIMHGINDVRKETFFEMAEEDRGTRRGKFKIQKRTRLTIRKNSFSHRVVSTWNRLPDSVVCANSVNEFKNGVDKALGKYIDKYSYGTGPEWLFNQSQFPVM